jgi:hypothetical protein
MSHSPTMVRSPVAKLPSFNKLKQNNQLYKKRGLYTMKYSYVHKERELSSQRTNVSPNKQRNNDTICTSSVAT